MLKFWYLFSPGSNFLPILLKNTDKNNKESESFCDFLLKPCFVSFIEREELSKRGKQSVWVEGLVKCYLVEFHYGGMFYELF
jgi:hypothetical protein